MIKNERCTPRLRRMLRPGRPPAGYHHAPFILRLPSLLFHPQPKLLSPTPNTTSKHQSPNPGWFHLANPESSTKHQPPNPGRFFRPGRPPAGHNDLPYFLRLPPLLDHPESQLLSLTPIPKSKHQSPNPETFHQTPNSKSNTKDQVPNPGRF